MQQKIQRAIKLIQSAAAATDVVEVAYSGGKDSDVILQLTKEANVPYKAIYKATTIDPPGTIRHAKNVGAEIRVPQKTFRQVIADSGIPDKFHRSCCGYFKEYKILDKVIMGIRACESIKRRINYTEPSECRIYKTADKRIEAFYPILEWTDEDCLTFINDRQLQLHPLYYRNDGTIDMSRRLGCIGCPLAYRTKRIAMFKQYPKYLRIWITGGNEYMAAHPHTKTVQKWKGDIYKQMYAQLFCNNPEDIAYRVKGFFEDDDFYKSLLEYHFQEYHFQISLDIQ